jgi:hypothetical protein
MHRHWFVVGLWCGCCGAALAQEPGLSVSAGLRVWYAGWTTFSYLDDGRGNRALVQSSADDKLVLLPALSLRYGDLLASFSALPSTRFALDNDIGTRQEYDLNLGYTVMPGLTLTAGYKTVSQRGSSGNYRPRGAVVGMTANAPLSGPVFLYGSFGAGRLKTPSGDDIQFVADYRLTELGLAYSFTTDSVLRRLSFTAGYRTQAIFSKEAVVTQGGKARDGVDRSQGFTLGVIASY